jgi:hypothetical protein
MPWLLTILEGAMGAGYFGVCVGTVAAPKYEKRERALGSGCGANEEMWCCVDDADVCLHKTRHRM